MDIKKTFQSKPFATVLVLIGILIIGLLIFQAGIFVGYHKAGYSFRLGQDYYRTFGQERGAFPENMPGYGFPNPNGAVGKIIKISLPTLIIDDQTGVEKVALITNDTLIRQFRNMLSAKDLKVNDFVVIIGSPNSQNQIEARLIRLIPPPPNFGNNLNSTSTPK